jgi:hypothetical protein
MPAAAMPSAAPDAILHRRRQVILDRDADGFAALFAPDAVIEMPFAGTPESPMRLAGRDAIGEYARRVMASPLRLEDFDVTALHHTQDPEVVVVEMRSAGTFTASGRTFSVTSVQILRIRDGLITLFRDFADPRVADEIVAGAGPTA